MTEHITVGDDLIAIRHYLHQHPERSFEEHDTSAYLARQLCEHGIDVLDTTLETGVVGLIEGDRPGPRIALRADIDGLPVHEETGLPFVSVNDGVMHACGHDLHMTGLLGAAFWLADHRDRIAGSIKIIFQPAEELGMGARRVIAAGVADDVEAIIGTHNNPNYAPGQIAIGPEPMMAGCVKFKVTLHAQGTHAGYPQKGTGPIEALATMILALQTIVSRNISPFHAVVLSITEVHGGDVWNVVPAEAGFQGTVRFFDNDDEALVHRRFVAEVNHTAEAYGIGADVDWDCIQLPLVNDAPLAEAVAADVPQYATLKSIRASMAGEDFVEFGRKARLVFAFIGSNGQEGCADWHSPHFVGLDGAIEPAVNFYANAALRVLDELH
ncbi:n-acyl-L-amino acid amidohydrolase [Bifidobacterium ramosum]|uniref:Amidohydrolase n=1 Tax=Bifidobacterium ramosum TaxID=1798158 RepID=A0A6L4X338_9BIFI|nr:amidohydrolase [Bifidobacterium ramosum]KAB8289224.1 n-acyl-L-amino acid amidohydrolase [Bifidobacterium ramosum]NEG70930.1 amidohydrolase [Bifidobacterium ramosum]